MLYHPFISIVKEYKKIDIVLNNRSSKRNKSDFDWRYIFVRIIFIWCNDHLFLLFRCTNISSLVDCIPFSHKNRKFRIQLLMLIQEMQYLVSKYFRLYIDKVWFWHITIIHFWILRIKLFTQSVSWYKQRDLDSHHN